ncbi:hypothetical protein OHA40_32250 [Nocardia sp. NBC_00508]|uniref:hypothetical protein n=1 Tax=Nocardia sp. NBC_00508 TaxID=2975992 RepID=UPI002E8149A0|nr:hypothetical protein [Nocardia sp. NBC_00508]WUD66178.1 hypothetical protein OHA40_32250 [Nocardia sp. NBC_00508]
MQTDLLLIAQPTAVRCACNLVQLRLSHWGLSHVSSVMETLTRDLVDAVVRTIGSSKHDRPEPEDNIPLIRCVLWLRSGVIGFAVEDPTEVNIPTPPVATLYPAVRWDRTRLTTGKATWFIVPVPSTLSRSDQRSSALSPRRVGHV